MKVLGYDPGSKKAGWGFVETKSVPPFYTNLGMGIIKAENFPKQMWHQIQEFKPDIVVIEDFIKRPDYGNNMWVELPTAKQIGRIQQCCDILGIPWTLAQPIDKGVGYGMAFQGTLKYVQGKKNMDAWDAISHCVYYIVTGGKWKN